MVHQSNQSPQRKFLVSRTATFRDRGSWGERVDVIDEVASVHSRDLRLPKPLQSLEVKWHQLSFCLKLLRISRSYDALAVGRYGLPLPILQKFLGLKRPVVLTEAEWPGFGSGSMNRLAGNAASSICCFTRLEMQRYSKHFSIPLSKFRFVPLAFQSSDVEPYSPTDSGYIFSGGHQVRDWETFLRAVDGLDCPVRLWARSCDPRSLPANVTLRSGERSAFYSEMASASCVVVPILQERLRIAGITTWINAMAMGKVVIVTDRDGAPDYIEHGVSGFCVEHGDVGELRRYIELVMSDSALRRRVGAAARERAEREFSPQVFRRRVLQLLEEACENSL